VLRIVTRAEKEMQPRRRDGATARRADAKKTLVVVLLFAFVLRAVAPSRLCLKRRAGALARAKARFGAATNFLCRC
jgi:hypothetical protein